MGRHSEERSVIRELREADAAAVVRLLVGINPHQVVTPEGIWYRASRPVERARRRDWVAEAGGRIVAYAKVGFEWSVPTPGKAWLWVGVHRERRGEGFGGALYATALEYLLAQGARRLRTWVDADPEGESFVRELGFHPRGVDVVSELDPREVDVSELRQLESRGFALAALRDVRHGVHDLHAICAAGERDMPGEEPETELDLESWKRDEFELPDLSHDGSFVVLAGKRPVSLAFLRVDPERRLGYNQMTATLPEYRRRGLALMVKLAAACWAAKAGIERLLTENDVDNTGMRAINERLGYRPLYEQRSWVLELQRESERERPPRERR